MRGLALEHAVADLALGILDQQTALGALHEHDEGDHDDRHATMTTRIRLVDSAPGGRVPACRRWPRAIPATMPAMMMSEMPTNARAVTAAEPHQEHGAAGDADRGRNPEEIAGISTAPPRLRARLRCRPERRQHHGG
jgi:hypothetical protein